MSQESDKNIVAGGLILLGLGMLAVPPAFPLGLMSLCLGCAVLGGDVLC